MNYALNYATGDFILLLAPDDRLSNDILEKTLERQLQTDADIVIPDCCFYYPDDTKKNWIMSGVLKDFGKSEIYKDKSVILSNREAVEFSLDWKIHAFCLYSASIIKNIRYCEEGMIGDEYSAREFFLAANKIAFSDGTYFYYQINNSITKKLSPKRFNTLMPLYLLEEFLIKNKFKKNI